jgi:hypothetical protein
VDIYVQIASEVSVVEAASNNMTKQKPLKVEKEKFDDLLRRMISAKPTPKMEINARSASCRRFR